MVIQERINPSALNSESECRSWMLYHFVQGTAEVAAGPPNPTVVVTGEIGTGLGSGASAKSAKSIIGGQIWVASLRVEIATDINWCRNSCY